MDLNLKFEARMKKLISDYSAYCKILDERYLNSIRCNIIKISPEKLKKRLEKKWKIKQPYKDNPEIMIIDQELEPGEIGKAIEHQLGYYYVQEISSMMPPIALDVKKDEIILDIAAAPGSKTTQIANMMNNQGGLIANDVNIGRIGILSTNLQRCAVTNCIVTRHEGANLCKRFSEMNFKFDKILLDAPCTGEGNLRTNPATAKMFSEHLIKKLSNIQKSLLRSCIKILKSGGTLIYSTCTYSPEENEEVINEILKENPDLKLQQIKLPLKTREGITKWQDKKFDNQLKLCARIYPQDNNTEGFFIAKIKKVK